MRRIVHVISSLEVGGAETYLSRLVAAADRTRFPQVVVSLLKDEGRIAAELRGIGIEVRNLRLNRFQQFLGPLLLGRLTRSLADLRPDVVQGWMYHSNLVAGWAGARLGVPVIWCIRQADLDNRIPLRTRVHARIGAQLSRRLPARIVYNSDAGQLTHAAAGYAQERASVIPNGFNTDVFKPDLQSRRNIRRELGVGEAVLLVAMVARYDAQKDHGNFLSAAAIVHQQMPSVRFVLCGKGMERSNEPLMAAVRRAGIEEALHLLGERDDVAAIDAAADVGCLSSRGEGFPNTLGEAMACGIPCAATAVGDVERLVGPTGKVVAARDPSALAKALLSLLAMAPGERASLGGAARQRIIDQFGIARSVAAYETLWSEVVRPVGVR